MKNTLLKDHIMVPITEINNYNIKRVVFSRFLIYNPEIKVYPTEIVFRNKFFGVSVLKSEIEFMTVNIRYKELFIKKLR